jgi:peptidyl-prolyl cis-trans isomerase B (cyclophilin B)
MRLIDKGVMKNNDKLASFQAKQGIKVEREATRRKDNRLALIVSGAAVALAVVGQLLYFSVGPGFVAPVEEVASEEPTPIQTNSDQVPDPSLAEGRTWTGSLNLNDQTLGLELFGDLAPQATANFVSLAKDGFFEGVSCHRLTTAGIFVLQCGDPTGTGSGGPGYNFGPIENAPMDDMYGEGVLAMARVGGDGYSMGSQFFIVYGNSQILSDAAGGYTVFGKITSGLDGVKAIAEAGTTDGSSDGAPINPVSLSGISVE